MNNLPPLYNTRAEQQWDIIKKHVDFEGKEVVDIGCGYGDILARCLVEGKAKSVHGYDKDRVVVENARSRFYNAGLDSSRYEFAPYEIFDSNGLPMGDIGICFSVIPYLNLAEITNLLTSMEILYDVSLIEVQYVGDGPGDDLGIEDDTIFGIFLGGFFNSVTPIGSTEVVGRHVRRTIWLCK